MNIERYVSSHKYSHFLYKCFMKLLCHFAWVPQGKSILSDPSDVDCNICFHANVEVTMRYGKGERYAERMMSNQTSRWRRGDWKKSAFGVLWPFACDANRRLCYLTWGCQLLCFLPLYSNDSQHQPHKLKHKHAQRPTLLFPCCGKTPNGPVHLSTDKDTGASTLTHTHTNTDWQPVPCLYCYTWLMEMFHGECMSQGCSDSVKGSSRV